MIDERHLAYVSSRLSNCHRAAVHDDLNLAVEDHQEVILGSPLLNQCLSLGKREKLASTLDSRRDSQVSGNQGLGT